MSYTWEHFYCICNRYSNIWSQSSTTILHQAPVPVLSGHPQCIVHVLQIWFHSFNCLVHSASSPFLSVPHFRPSIRTLNFVSQLCPSIISLNSDPQLRLSLFPQVFPSTPFLDYSVPQHCPSTLSLNSVPQFCPTILSLNSITQHLTLISVHQCSLNSFLQHRPSIILSHCSIIPYINFVPQFCPKILELSNRIEGQN